MMVDGEVTTEAVTSARHGRRGGGAGVLRGEQGDHEADPASEQRPLSGGRTDVLQRRQRRRRRARMRRGATTGFPNKKCN